jgi:acetyl esterase/lipase
LAPQHQFPCAIIDIISGYQHLLKSHAASDIVISGVSAGTFDLNTGGGLTLSLLLAIREMGLPTPGGAVMISPWVDLTRSFPSFSANAQMDYLPNASEEILAYYAPNEVKKNQYASPIWAQDFSNMPPILIQVGEKERLHDEDVAVAHKLAQFGNKVELEVYEDSFHAFPMFAFLPAARVALLSCSEFISRRKDLPGHSLLTRLCHKGKNLNSATLSPKL